MQPDEKSVRYTPTRRDVLAFQTRTGFCNRFVFGLACFCFLAVVITVLTLPLDPADLFAVKLITAIVTGIFALMAGGIAGYLFVAVTVWKGKFKNVLTEQTATITPEGLMGTSAFGDGVTKWAGIHKVVSTKKLLIVYTNETTARIIPKRFFSTPESAAAFERDIRARLQPD